MSWTGLEFTGSWPSWETLLAGYASFILLYFFAINS